MLPTDMSSACRNPFSCCCCTLLQRQQHYCQIPCKKPNVVTALTMSVDHETWELLCMLLRCRVLVHVLLHCDQGQTITNPPGCATASSALAPGHCLHVAHCKLE